MSKPEPRVIARLPDDVGSPRCGKCSNKVLQKSEAGVTIHARGPIAFSSDGCAFRCKSCGADVHLAVGLVDTRGRKL